MRIQRLITSIFDVQVDRLPIRQLKLLCEVNNPESFDICIFDSWVTIEAFSGLKLAEGRIFHSMHNSIDPATIPKNKSIQGAFVFELSPMVLHCIEEHRAGGDINLIITSRVLVTEVWKVNEMKTLGVPFETAFGNEYTSRFEHLIPQSEWIKLLKSLEWSELEIIELPSSKLRSIPTLAHALGCFENARTCYRQGNWAETLLNCRKVVEAIVKSGSETNNMKKALEVFKTLIDDDTKAKCINEFVKEFNKFLHLGRHVQHPNISIKRTDAQLALQMTGTLLMYLGGQ